jgi:hypothetical protein
MQIDVYKSNSSSKYLVVPAGKNVAELTVADVDMAEVSTFKKNLEMDHTKPLIGLDQKAALAAIEVNGYYIQGIKIDMKVG